MPRGSRRLTSCNAVLLASFTICSFLNASPVAGGAQTSQTIRTSTSQRPPRVVTDLTALHLGASQTSSPPNQRGAVSRGGEAALFLCAPVLGATGSVTPLFVWSESASGAASKTLTVLSADADVLYEAEVSGSSFRYPAGATALQPGLRYTWKVSGKGMAQVPDAVAFVIKSGTAPKAATGDPLAVAQTQMLRGLWYDAVDALLAGIHDEPGRKDLLQQLNVLYQQIAPGCAVP